MAMTADMAVGLEDKVLSAQSIFRVVMNALANPGSLHHVVQPAAAPAGVMRGTAAIALTLFDHDTPIWLDSTFSSSSDVVGWLKFHTGAPVVDDPFACSFAVIGDGAELPALTRFAFGTDEYPDRSTTIILQAPSLSQGDTYHLRGPGIDGVSALTATLNPADLFEHLIINETAFPRGIDVLLVAGDTISAIPRTTRLVKQGN